MQHRNIIPLVPHYNTSLKRTLDEHRLKLDMADNSQKASFASETANLEAIHHPNDAGKCKEICSNEGIPAPAHFARKRNQIASSQASIPSRCSADQHDLLLSLDQLPTVEISGDLWGGTSTPRRETNVYVAHREYVLRVLITDEVGRENEPEQEGWDELLAEGVF